VRPLAAILLASVLLSAGCSGTTSPTSTTPSTTGDTGEPTSTTVVAGPEPAELIPFWGVSTDEVIYFVMVDRFFNGSTANDTGGSSADDPLVHGFLATDKGYFHGGDIAGLESKLDYLRGMGITAIWLTPPFVNRAVQGRGTVANSSAGYHGYWIVDFEAIDPHFGDNAEMRGFIDAAHEVGIKVFFDIVVNHTADVISFAETGSSYRSIKFAPYRDANGIEFDVVDYVGTNVFPDLDRGVSFPYTPVFVTPADAAIKNPDWLDDPIYYHNRGNTNFTAENDQLGDFFGLDDLFTEHPAVVRGLIDIYRGVIEEFDVDGFRVDTARHVNDEFWLEFIPAILDHAAALGKRDFLLFGEVSGSDPIFNSRYVSELGFPSVLDFGFSSAVSTFVSGRAGPKVLADHFDDDDWYTIGGGDAGRLVTFIGNHDMGRLGWFIRSADPNAGDEERLRRASLALGLLFTSRGTPTIYYGDEQGFVGDGGDKDARQDMFASLVDSYNDDDLIGTDATTADANFDPRHPLYRLISQLSEMRLSHPALAHGVQITRYSQVNPGVFAFSRLDRDTLVEYLVVANNATTEQLVDFRVAAASATFDAVFPQGRPSLTAADDGRVELAVPALGLAVYRADRPVPASGVAPGIRIVRPLDGSVVDLDRFRIEAEIDSEAYVSVSFAVSVDGGPRVNLGTDWAPPYRVYLASTAFPAGAAVEIAATVRDSSGSEVTTMSRVTLGPRD